MSVRDELLSLEDIPKNWYWDKSILPSLSDKFDRIKEELRPLQERHVQYYNIIKKAAERIYSVQEKNYDDAVNEIKKINETIDVIKMQTKSLDERVFEEEQARKDTPKKQGVVKKIITYGLVLFSLGIYHPKNVEAGQVNVGVENGKTNVYVTPNGSVGVNAQTGEHVVFPGGNNVGMTREGRVVVAPGNNPKIEYNLATPQRYIDEANKAYKNDDYNKIIDLSEEALVRIREGKLRATNKEIEMIKQNKLNGYDLMK